MTDRDPTPWVHVSGERASSPYSRPDLIGGYTYDPREGYTDYSERFISTRGSRQAGIPTNGEQR